ncbi:MAG: hypothetical protein WC289_03500 [Patescibacteria group bacterium]|jgi:hypothetical protein
MLKPQLVITGLIGEELFSSMSDLLTEALPNVQVIRRVPSTDMIRRSTRNPNLVLITNFRLGGQLNAPDIIRANPDTRFLLMVDRSTEGNVESFDNVAIVHKPCGIAELASAICSSMTLMSVGV